MATLKVIRKRITSVKNTQKITKAMKMVAAAKLRRAQQAVVASRPYANSLGQVIAQISEKGESGAHPLFVAKESPKKASFLMYTSNRGLCGGFNSNLLRRSERQFAENFTHLELLDIQMIGKKGRDFYRSRKRSPSEIFLKWADSFTFEEASEVAGKMIAGFLEGQFDEYYLVFNQFKSALSQEVTFQKLLPFQPEGEKKKENSNEALNLVDYIYEPSRQQVLDYLIPKVLATHIYRAHLESVASELGARMTAMENATGNANDMISRLTLQYNRARQASITKELMDIVNGAESIK